MSVFRRLFREVVRVEPRIGGSKHADSTDLPLETSGLDREAGEIRSSRATLSHAYSRYVAAVSSEDMAISIETASLLFALCQRIRPSHILDLGSGFSSFTFRLYARMADHPCLVHTVDDDEAWLDRTRGFLSGEGLVPEGLFPWSQFENAGCSGYAVVLHDLGRMPRRAATVEFAVSCLAANGTLVLDDMHKPHYAAHAEAACTRAGLRVVPLRELTLDRFGRFASLAIPTAPSRA
jgi:hypothetical protein